MIFSAWKIMSVAKGSTLMYRKLAAMGVAGIMATTIATPASAAGPAACKVPSPSWGVCKFSFETRDFFTSEGGTKYKVTKRRKVKIRLTHKARNRPVHVRLVTAGKKTPLTGWKELKWRKGDSFYTLDNIRTKDRKFPKGTIFKIQAKATRAGKIIGEVIP